MVKRVRNRDRFAIAVAEISRGAFIGTAEAVPFRIIYSDCQHTKPRPSE
jgi:hypothetical protein